MDLVYSPTPALCESQNGGRQTMHLHLGAWAAVGPETPIEAFVFLLPRPNPSWAPEAPLRLPTFARDGVVMGLGCVTLEGESVFGIRLSVLMGAKSASGGNTLDHAS